MELDLTRVNAKALRSPTDEEITRSDNTTNTGLRLGASSIDEDRPFKVVVIGAGFSGITAGIRFVSFSI